MERVILLYHQSFSGKMLGMRMTGDILMHGLGKVKYCRYGMLHEA